MKKAKLLELFNYRTKFGTIGKFLLKKKDNWIQFKFKKILTNGSLFKAYLKVDLVIAKIMLDNMLKISFVSLPSDTVLQSRCILQ